MIVLLQKRRKLYRVFLDITLDSFFIDPKTVAI